jgi:hypothetical protein
LSTEILLTEISALTRKHDYINRKTGGYFNIFEIANIATKEVTICRVLYEILNPKGCHYQGDKYLKLFFKYVLGLDIEERECQNASVFREYVIDNQRRIDLVIETANLFIPIEVKIYADDQEEQCAAYNAKAKKSDVYYLTLYGTQPADYSAQGLEKKGIEGYEGVTAISFENHIIDWLYKCLEQKETITIAPIREILLQLISILRKLTGQLEVSQEMEMKELLMKSSDNMKSAFAIERSIKECKIELLRKLFGALESELEKQGKQRIVIDDYDGDKIKNYYDRKDSTYPGLSYIYKENVKPDTDILFRVEIDHRLFAGFCVAYKEKSVEQILQILTEDEIKKHIQHVNLRLGGKWAYWEYLPEDNQGASPNFKYPDDNDNYFKLYDENFFNEFIAECIKKINMILEPLIFGNTIGKY